MRHYGVSLTELLTEWTLPQALEFGKVAVRVSTEQRIATLCDMAHAFASTSKEGNKGFKKLIDSLNEEL